MYEDLSIIVWGPNVTDWNWGKHQIKQIETEGNRLNETDWNTLNVKDYNWEKQIKINRLKLSKTD